MNPTNFNDIRGEIQEALNSRSVHLGINEPVTLLDGFINVPIYNQLSRNVVIGGPTVPMIAVVGNNSGRVYYFALGQLLPHLLRS